jgi:hypothetical protein
MYNQTIRLYQLVTGSWIRLTFVDDVLIVPMDDRTPMEIQDSGNSNIQSYLLTNGRTVHHVPEYATSPGEMRFNYGWIDIAKVSAWRSLQGTRLRVRQIHWEDKDKAGFRTETNEALVSTAQVVRVIKSVPQKFMLEVMMLNKEYDSSIYPTVSDLKETVSDWEDIDLFPDNVAPYQGGWK